MRSIGGRAGARPRRATALAGVVAASAVALPAAMLPAASPAQARIVVATQRGLDACTAPSAAALAKWQGASPFHWVGIYVGGSMRSCSQPQLTAAWVSTVTRSQSWQLLPLWAGPQSPCWVQSGGRRFSLNTTTARAQGGAEAAAALAAVRGLGISTSTARNVSIAYDLEPFTISAACVASAQAFVQGWDARLAAAPAQLSGVYGSVSASDLTAFTRIPTPPSFIWGAKWDGIRDVAVLNPVPATAWVHNQRFKQYRGNHAETYGGIRLMVDSNVANGPAFDS